MPPKDGGVHGNINPDCRASQIDSIELIDAVDITVSIKDMVAIEMVSIDHDEKVIEGQVLLRKKKPAKFSSSLEWATVARVSGSSDNFSSHRMLYIAD